ncbi:MAG: hypothetical protein LBT06_04805 [Hungatella sp.]|jgi:protein FrlC|nr:hypothetical protein [Hungatella sp.]
MSKITMDQIGVMSVQYIHYSLEYYLDSMKRCGLKHVDLWGGNSSLLQVGLSLCVRCRS